jgi:sRNA-binding carbon storage regulator CsrA
VEREDEVILIDTEQVVKIYGVTRGLFNSTRLGIGAPAHVKRFNRKNWYIEKECKEWAANNNFWELAMHYRRSQCYKTLSKEETLTRRRAGRPTKGDRPIELLERDLKERTPPLMRLFLQGKFSPNRRLL